MRAAGSRGQRRRPRRRQRLKFHHASSTTALTPDLTDSRLPRVEAPEEARRVGREGAPALFSRPDALDRAGCMIIHRASRIATLQVACGHNTTGGGGAAGAAAGCGGELAELQECACAGRPLLPVRQVLFRQRQARVYIQPRMQARQAVAARQQQSRHAGAACCAKHHNTQLHIALWRGCPITPACVSSRTAQTICAGPQLAPPALGTSGVHRWSMDRTSTAALSHVLPAPT